MAIKIIDGKPGSGKTYYAVAHLAGNYFEKDGSGTMVLNKDVTLITNIEDFKPKHLNLKELIEGAGGVSKFFSFAFQEQFKENKSPIVYIIDEAQVYFRKNDRTLTDVFTWLEYHRHWGQEVYLVTQNAKKLPYDIVILTEFIISARPRSRSITGGFKYFWMSDKEVLKTETLTPSQDVFGLYTSQLLEESEKVKNPMIKTIVLTLGSCIVLMCLFFYYFKTSWGGAGKKEAEKRAIDNPAIMVASTPMRHKAGIAPETIVYSKLSVIKEYFDGIIRVSVIHDNNIVPLDIFPYDYQIIKGDYYASLPQAKEQSKY